MRLSSLFALGLLNLSLTAPLSLLPVTAAHARPPMTCGTDSYVNSRDNCVHRPVRAPGPPAGATAKCRDGTYSFSESRRGTCSWHGGVARWL